MECEFGDEEWALKDPETVYTCTVTSCNITTRGSVVAAFKGAHKRSKDNSDVKGLSFENTKVHYVPRNLLKIFPNLSFLLIQNCGLKEVSAEDMTGLEKLKVFWSLYNQITTLPVDLFKNTPNLKEVSFKENLITKFDAELLEPIKDTIEVFNILRNPGIDKIYRKSFHPVKEFIESLKKPTRLENLYTSSKHSDFTIEVNGKEFQVHKCFLASMSPFFDRMFSSDTSLASKSFENIKQFGHAAIEEFLRYFYTQAIPSEENADEMLKLAIEFEVSDLKLQCEAILAKTISPENALNLYNLADRHSLHDLKREAFEAIQKRHPEIADYLIDEPELVSANIEAKNKHQAKKIKLEKEE